VESLPLKLTDVLLAFIHLDVPVSIKISGTLPQRWVTDGWVFTERTSWPKIPQLSLKHRVILCDESGAPYGQLCHQFDDVEFVDTVDLVQTVQELRASPAHAVIFNSVSPDTLRPLIEQAWRHLPDIPVFGCAIPSKTSEFLDAGAVDYLIKPVVQDNLKEVLQALDKPVKHILLADDNAEFRQLRTRILRIIDSGQRDDRCARQPDYYNFTG
jgi:CheY-like chemotaxis protein